MGIPEPSIGFWPVTSGYQKIVPRLWPSLRARVASSGGKARWAEGFKAEGWYWGVALSVIVFAITLSLKLFFWILGASLVLFWVSSKVLQKNNTTEARGH